MRSSQGVGRGRVPALSIRRKKGERNVDRGDQRKPDDRRALVALVLGLPDKRDEG